MRIDFLKGLRFKTSQMFYSVSNILRDLRSVDVEVFNERRDNFFLRYQLNSH